MLSWNGQASWRWSRSCTGPSPPSPPSRSGPPSKARAVIPGPAAALPDGDAGTAAPLRRYERRARGPRGARQSSTSFTRSPALIAVISAPCSARALRRMRGVCCRDRTGAMNFLRHHLDRRDQMRVAATGEEDPVAIGAKWQDGQAAHARNAAAAVLAGRITGFPRPLGWR